MKVLLRASFTSGNSSLNSWPNWYIDNEEGIKKYFAAFHMHDPAPVSVIIDDFADFFYQGDLAMVRVLALCRNAILYANEKGPCQLLLSDTHNGDSPRLLYLYKRWVSSIYTIKGDGSGSYLIRSSNNSGVAKSAGTKLAKYSIALQYLVFEGITEDEEQSVLSLLGDGLSLTSIRYISTTQVISQTSAGKILDTSSI
ncbi:hypothetical protein HAX54_006179 [Datura stramonium]|uniref:Uncharacterized protein n=1 Tax=Datura stramonium TaxID=4076 RepID=A0ABS8TB27_DATST|nr:hypothetical protein [Datura stramonium]